MIGLFAHAAELEKNNLSFAFIQIIESRGSTPRHAAGMIVDDQGNMTGTIGGGMMERLVLEQALQALAQGESRVFQGRMARQGEGAIGSDCGGAMTVHIAVHLHRPELILVGGGHVNRAIAQAAAPLGFRITVLDIWPGNLDPAQLPPQCRRIHADTFTLAIDELQLNDNCFVIIATNNQDREALTRLIPTQVAYLGLLASRRKVQTLKAALRKQGVSEETITQLRSPIGLDIGAETPEEIAISVLAELLQVKNRTHGQSMNVVDKIAIPLNAASGEN
ncbi:XdhC family protein [Brenneria izbisi]|uniref:XdhC family protein n=1 Tax=Brenneria izbisi TaxID=2939450 RepID=A0AA42C1K9_9GAMM|nr:XdhC family protein [Brenneria izbisi]MCV9879397.1 XdhC family protein [Brenneria izbisi]MCV9882597.1 XdhC family protein [Brenneria izbisi]